VASAWKPTDDELAFLKRLAESEGAWVDGDQEAFPPEMPDDGTDILLALVEELQQARALLAEVRRG
jgi:hypothetical protein